MADFIQQLAASLDPATREEFGPIEQEILRRSMDTVNMERYPAVRGDPHGERASGDYLCVCGQPYFAHPMDWRVIGYGHVPFLNVLCDGRRVKL